MDFGFAIGAGMMPVGINKGHRALSAATSGRDCRLN